MTTVRFLLILLSFFAGGLICFSIAPFNYWILGILSIALFNLALFSQAGKAPRYFWNSFFYGLGLFGFSVSWVYVSMTRYGGASPLLAFIMTGGFVAFLSLVYALPLAAYGKLLSRKQPGVLSARQQWLQQVLGFSAVLVVGDWLRGWLLTGFPWAYIGYGHIGSALAGWAPVGGVLTINFIVYFIAASGTYLLKALYSKRGQASTTDLNQKTEYVLTGDPGDTFVKLTQTRSSVPIGIATLVVSLGFFIGGAALKAVSYTKPYGETKAVVLIQPNIPQEYKWQQAYDEFITDRLFELTFMEDQSTPPDIILWPEAALPGFYSESQDVFNEVHKRSLINAANDSQLSPNLVTGVLFDDRNAYRYYNALVVAGPDTRRTSSTATQSTATFSSRASEDPSGLSQNHSLYYKQRLVPFGEYVPLEAQLRGLIDFFNLPRSYISRGPLVSEPLVLQNILIAPSVCYEIAYPDLVAKLAKDAHILVTISNDAWFGRSIAANQHYQMASMRALEHQKPLLRATNTGITGIVNYRGESLRELPLFKPDRLEGVIQPRKGNTLFSRTGSRIILLLCGLSLLLVFFTRHPMDGTERD